MKIKIGMLKRMIVEASGDNDNTAFWKEASKARHRVRWPEASHHMPSEAAAAFEDKFINGRNEDPNSFLFTYDVSTISFAYPNKNYIVYNSNDDEYWEWNSRRGEWTLANY